jgi:hypothetical protein
MNLDSMKYKYVNKYISPIIQWVPRQSGHCEGLIDRLIDWLIDWLSEGDCERMILFRGASEFGDIFAWLKCET